MPPLLLRAEGEGAAEEWEHVVLHAIRELAPDLKQVERFYVRRLSP